MTIKSIGKMIELIHGLCDTKDVTPWENDFIKRVHAAYMHSKSTSHLTNKQVEIIDKIHGKHFA